MKYPENSNWVNQHADRLQRFDAARLIPRDLKCGLKALLVTRVLIGLVACDSFSDASNSLLNAIPDSCLSPTDVSALYLLQTLFLASTREYAPLF